MNRNNMDVLRMIVEEKRRMWQLLWLDNTDTGCWRLILVMLWSLMMLKRKTKRKKKTEEQFLWTLYEDKPARLIIRFVIGFV